MDDHGPPPRKVSYFLFSVQPKFCCKLLYLHQVGWVCIGQKDNSIPALPASIHGVARRSPLQLPFTQADGCATHGNPSSSNMRKAPKQGIPGKGLAYQRSSGFQLSTVICLSHISLSFVSASMSSRACIFCGGPAAPGSPPQPVMGLDYRVIYI